MTLPALLKAIGVVFAKNLDLSLSKLFQNCENLVLGVERKVVLDSPNRPQMEDGILYASDDCKKLESKLKRAGPICKGADMRPKILPPYSYGYCKEKEPELPMSCPPKIRKRGRGPCCHDEVKQSKGGCKSN